MVIMEKNIDNQSKYNYLSISSKKEVLAFLDSKNEEVAFSK